MTSPTTSRDIQRITFVESLHNSLKKQAVKAIADHHKFIALANSYIKDGLEESECIELLMIDGSSREAAESYASMATSKKAEEEHSGLIEYSFQFEDVYGKTWSSFDINKTVQAADDDGAWAKAEELIDKELSVESNKVISVSRIS